ncbi:MAG: DUF1080 domain-containing protein [Planctomycetes bacterium]|nr:DUF1080 domain-containing protein [Planctomycetota bacterium]
MRKSILCLAIFISWAAVVCAADPVPPKAHPDATGWKTLFAGDLSDAIHPEGVWSVENGVLTAAEDKCIWSKKEYENFILDLEFKTAPGANSGVFVYGADPVKWVTTSVEIQIADDHAEQWAKSPKTWQCGAIFGRLAAKKSTVKKPGEWNRMTITCKGPMIYVMLNGELVTEMDMRKWTSGRKNSDGSDIPKWLGKPLAERPTKGHVGLQGKHAGAPIYFRNVKIKELD